MNKRKYEIMEAHLKGELSVSDLIDRIVELEQHEEKPKKKTGYSVKDYIIYDRLDACNVLSALIECAEKYSTVSVADYYSLISSPCTYVDNAYGWCSNCIKQAKVVEVRGGYTIIFPEVEEL